MSPPGRALAFAGHSTKSVKTVAKEKTSDLSPLIRPRFTISEVDLDQDLDDLLEQGRENLRQKVYPGAEDSRVSARYGQAGNAGWSPIPDVLLFNQHRLKLKGDDLVVLLNLMAHYYSKNEMPFIRPTTIAKRMGVSQRTVQRSLAKLHKLGLFWKVRNKEHGHLTYDLTPLIEKLQPWGEERMADNRLRCEQRSVAQQDRALGVEIRL
jgi:DNA-binding MarR family transcriptional regulator